MPHSLVTLDTSHFINMLKFSYCLGFIVRNYSSKVPINKPHFPNLTKDTVFKLNKPQLNKVPKVALQCPTNIEELPIKNNPRKARTSKTVHLHWTDQQLKIFDAVENRQSVFITGSAGTGKTKLILEIIKRLRKVHGRKGVMVTAPTGVVACALGGQTLLSFAGVGLAQADAETLLSKVLGNRFVMRRWKMVKALVIDEISMVEGELFDKLEYIARVIRENDEPWGGIQLVVSGDFLQLPPVSVDSRSDCGKEFAFEADCWDRSFQLQVCLSTVYRQSDPELIRVLQGIRRGELDDEGFELLERCRCSQEPDETVVRLFPRLVDVSRVNTMRLKGLGEEIIVYRAFDTGNKPWVDQLDRGIAPNELHLCKGARVMLTKNLNVKDKLVNGAAGTIVEFQKTRKFKNAKICDVDLAPVVKFDSGLMKVIEPCTWDVMVGDRKCATRLQLPLILAWAMSIHKSQGMTLDRLHTNLSSAFGFGMIYVALSRLRSLDGLSFCSSIAPSKIKAHPKVLQYYNEQF